VRRVETEQGDVWQTTLMTSEGQKKESFSTGRYGEEAAKSMAIAQRARWLRGLPVKHLAYAHHAEAITRDNFAEDLVPTADVLPQAQISDEEGLARIAAINARFDAYRPPRLRVWVKSYGKDRVSIAVSDAGQPAQRKIVQVNTASISADELRGSVKARIGAMIEAIYSADVARWFAKEHGDALLAGGAFELSEGFNVLVWIPEQRESRP
jgi:hypothetical protein